MLLKKLYYVMNAFIISQIFIINAPSIKMGKDSLCNCPDRGNIFNETDKKYENIQMKGNLIHFL